MTRSRSAILAGILLALVLLAGTGAALAGPSEALAPGATVTTEAASGTAPEPGATEPAESVAPPASSPDATAAPALAQVEPAAALTGVPGATRYEQTDSRLGYAGGWSADISMAEASGMSFRYAASQASVTVQFDGTYLAWIGQLHQAYGEARVTLDGGPSETIDLYSLSTVWRQPLWETGTLPSGVHTVVIEWTGATNPESLGTNIGIDAFDIVGTLQQAPRLTRYEQTDPQLAYAGAWSADVGAVEASGGSFCYAYGAQASLTVRFNGTYLAWIGQTHAAYGQARVTLDGGTSETIDLYSESAVWGQKIWETGTLPSGSHTVVIERTGEKNPAALGTNIGVDAFDIIGTLEQVPLPARIAQDDVFLWYQGLWTDWTSTLAYGNRATFARTPEDSVTATFTGTSLAWIAKTGPDCGQAQVALDGGDPMPVDLYSPTLVCKQKVWETGPLAEGVHTVTIEPTGAKNDSATDTAVNVDAFDIAGTFGPAGTAGTLEPTVPSAVAGLIVFDGNSLTLGVGCTPGAEYPARLVPVMPAGPWRAHNVAVGGQSTTGMLVDAATQIDRLYSSGYSRNILVCFTGSIDRLADGNTARQDKLRAYCTGRRAAGFTVIVLTLPSHLGEDYAGAERAQFNEWIRANYRGFADGLADVAAHPGLGAQGAYLESTYFADTIHLNDAGQSLVAEIVGQAIARLPLSLRGTDRYDTALKLSRSAFPEALPAGAGLVLAPGETFQEALCGGPLAAAYGGPVLLTPEVGLNNAVRAEILRLRPEHVVCVGLSEAVVTAVQDALDSLGTGGVAAAIRGADVYDMSYQVARALEGRVGDLSGTTAVITRGDLFPDAIAVSPLVCANLWPILLTDGATGVLHGSAAAALAELGLTTALKVGTYVTLAPGVAGVANLSGADRYVTNANVVRWATTNADLSFAHMAIATGDKFPDALAAGPYLARDRGILLLSPLNGPLPAVIAAEIAANATEVWKLTFIACIEPVIGQVKALLP